MCIRDSYLNGIRLSNAGKARIGVCHRALSRIILVNLGCLAAIRPNCAVKAARDSAAKLCRGLFSNIGLSASASVSDRLSTAGIAVAVARVNCAVFTSAC